MVESYKRHDSLGTKKENWFNKGLEPVLIQGGMGVAVSDWKLARSVAIAGEKLDQRVLGVVSGTALPIVMTQRLQEGDPDALAALEAFSKFNPEIVREIKETYPVRNPGERFTLPPKPSILVTGNQEAQRKMTDLAVVSAFSEVWLAKQGHNGPIGINLLEKIQLMHLPTILGAMMAGVDYTLIGAGIPNQFPELLNNFANRREAKYSVDVKTDKHHHVFLDPNLYVPEGMTLRRPKNFAIISLDLLAKILARKEGFDGFVVEDFDAGGHSAPPRGGEIDENREPLYTEKDVPDIGKIAALGKPFYLAGKYGTPEKLKEAQKFGAMGIQVGTNFALCAESGFEPNIADVLRLKIEADALKITNSADASPSGFPFKVAHVEGTLSESEIYEARERVCNMGYLEELAELEDGTIVSRCPADKVDIWVRKGGSEEDTHSKVCLCNALVSAAGHAHITGKGKVEPMIITLGKDVSGVKRLMAKFGKSYTAENVISFLTSSLN